MLRQNLELIVQYPEMAGYKCRGFRGLHLPAPAFIVFDGADHGDQPDANLLGNAFCAELQRFAGVQEESFMPCSGQQSQVGCHALDEPTCRKILVRTAGTIRPAGGWPAPNAESIWVRDWPKQNWAVVPIMPSGTTPANYLPSEWQGINAKFWRSDPTEALWAVLQHAGLAPEESRLFISYVRRDTTAIADQLFAALTMEGFDVFLDRTSVPIGVEFQERLMQDLVDKAMVVFLNSKRVRKSKWVAEEIATIKKYRLGLLELRCPGVAQRDDIDPDFTYQLDEIADLAPAGVGYTQKAKVLSKPALDRLVERIKETHGRALHRRRYELIDNFAAALAAAGKTADVLSDGTFVLQAHGSQSGAVVGLTSRIPELGDFCSLHERGNVSVAQPGWLISPSPFFVAQRRAHVSWLGGVSNIQHANEGQMSELAARI